MANGGLIVGLGNPGKEYEGTRHNFGFMLVERLLRACERDGLVRPIADRNAPYLLWRCTLRGASGDWFFTTPLTYMNRSGEAVQRVAAYYRLETESILALHDELDLPLGRMRLKQGGGSAGHNGIKSIQQMLGTPDFYRLRLGVGKPPGHDGASFVLSRFRQEERGTLEAVLDAATEGVLLYMREGPVMAQRFCNAFALPEDGEAQS
jgi:PTH1 family peptidyl-tRNA hydrolase